jgi:plasmid stabilization system protein ParE
MGLPVIYSAESSEDINEQINYYLTTAYPDIAQRFLHAVKAAVGRASEYPEGFPINPDNGARRVSASPFQCSVWYDATAELVTVLRVTHWRMDPARVSRLIDDSR